MCDCACICCSPENGPKAKRAIVVAIPAFILAIVGCLTGLVANRLYGIFALAGSAIGVVACLFVLCASGKDWKSAGSAAFVSAAVCLGGIVMLIYSLIGLPTYYDRCLVEHCSGEKWSHLAEELVPSWQLQICDDPCEGRTFICLTDIIGRDCASEEDCLGDSRSTEFCAVATRELLNSRIPAYIALAFAVINLAFQLSLGYTSFSAAGEPTPAAPDSAARREVPIPVAVPVATATGTQAV